MGINRRGFIKLAGLTTAVGLGGKKILGTIAGEDSTAVHPVPEQLPESLKAGRWAMIIDMTKCKSSEGCTVCMDTCHKIHNVPNFENPKDQIKWIWKQDFEGAFPGHDHKFLKEEIRHSHPILLCNHCDNPPCVKVCPTQATWKREDGIVMMDMHRCIGCRYCVVGCPYDSRSFNWRDPRPNIKEIDRDFPTRCRGVVEKCNFCAERLSRGKIPACVEVCPEKAMFFGDLDDPESEIRKILAENHTIRRKPILGTNPEVYYIV